MTKCAGKYDDLCTRVREVTEASGAIVIVIDGLMGSGFSVQGSQELTAALPYILEDMARQIRESLGKG